MSAAVDDLARARVAVDPVNASATAGPGTARSSASHASSKPPLVPGHARRWAGDLLALLPLVVLLPHLAGRDGGHGRAGTLVLAIATAVALPAVVNEVRRLPRPAVALLATWLVGLALGILGARYRADMAVPLMQYTVAPVLILCTRRVWRRRWGPGLLLALLGLAFAQYQVRSWLVWWAKTEAGTGLWQPLSWRNQSAALTGMFAVWFTGISLVSTRLVRVGFGLLAATGFAGTWLSSSRAGLVVTVAAAVVAVAVGVRSVQARHGAVWPALVTAAGIVATSAVLVLGLLAMQPSGTAQALASRDQGVGQNTLARIEHTEAALGMFVDRPLTGQGLGSYKAMARRWNDPTGGLTSSAHNEYAEVAGEAGVFAAVALFGTLVGMAVLGWRLLRRPPVPIDPADLRVPLMIGGTAAAALFLAHSAVDFDWRYPILSGLAAMATGMVLPDRVDRPTHRWAAVATATGLALLVVGGVVVGLVETRTDETTPWDDGARVAAGLAALEDGHAAEARRLAEAALRWNPGSLAAQSVAALARFELDGDVAALETALDQQPRWFAGRARGAMALAHAGHLEVASSVTAELHDDLDLFRAWGVTMTRLLTVEAEVATAAGESCTAAREVVHEAMAGDRTGARPLPATAGTVLQARLAAEGCTDS